jgi:predicted NACHT family NTPase
LILLRDHSSTIETNPQASLSEICQYRFGDKVYEPSYEWFDRHLRKGKCLVMLDGLDEAGDSRSVKIVGEWISRQINDYPLNYYLITSRPYGYIDQPIEKVKSILEIQPFSIPQTGEFIANWYLQSEVMRRLGRKDDSVIHQATLRANDLKSRIQKNRSILSLAVNPLLLTMIATVHDNRGALPGRRVELYSEICDVMLGRREEAKGLSKEIDLTAYQKRRVLQALAFRLMDAKSRTFSLQDAEDYLSERIKNVAGGRISVRDFLIDVEKKSSLVVQAEAGLYEFSHKINDSLESTDTKAAGLAAAVKLSQRIRNMEVLTEGT